MPKFSRAKNFTKANIEEIPKNKAIVYKLTNVAGDNLYTGIAGRGRTVERLLEHKEFKKDQIPGASHFKVAQVSTKERAAQIEKRIIKNEKPKFNIQHK